MRMKEAGLLDVCWKQFEVGSSYCRRKIDQETNKKKLDDNKKKLLTLKGMSGAFLVLATSYAIAVIVFILEIYNCHIISKEKY